MTDPEINRSVRVEEYRLLREEMLDNRRFVFERPIVLTGVLVAASGLVSGLSLGVLIFPFLATLFFNLWFTSNRLLSNARIVAYLHVVHETQRRPWVGWETALRIYRRRLAKHANTPLPQQDHLRYYTPILSFHLVLGSLVALLVSLRPSVQSWLATNLFVVNLGVVVLYVGLSLWLFSPAKVKGAIDRESQLWLAVLSEDGNDGQ